MTGFDLRAVDVSEVGRHWRRAVMDDDGGGCEDRDELEGEPLMLP